MGEVEDFAKRIAQELQGQGVHAAHNDSSEETHMVKSFMKSCPDCGLENPNYKEPKAFCNNKKCNAPLGSKEDAEKAGRCWNCGHDEAKILE